MEKIPSTIIIARLVFNEQAERFFNFPIKNPVRISIWEKGVGYSTPSEISSDTFIKMHLENKVKIMFPSTYLNRKLTIGDRFYIGPLSSFIGEVTVLEILTTNYFN